MKKIKEIIEVIKITLPITILPILGGYLSEIISKVITIEAIMTLIWFIAVISVIVLIKIEKYEKRMKKAAKRRKQIQIFDF